MVGPLLERGCHLCVVTRAVVETGNAFAMTAIVIEARFDHVRLDADVGHLGRSTSAQVVKTPFLDGVAELAIELGLETVPAGEAGAGAVAEKVVAVRPRH